MSYGCAMLAGMFDSRWGAAARLDDERLAAEAALVAAGDAGAAYRIGCHHANQEDWELRPQAEAWFVRAAQLGGPDAAWWIAHAYAYAFDGRSRQWLRRAVGTESDPDGIAVDHGTLAIVLDHGYPTHQRWRVRVRSDDRARAVAALTAACARVMCVAEDGREFGPDEDLPVLDGDGHELYTPNHAAVDDTGAVPELHLDCKDGVMPLLARTVIRIVAQELRAAGLPWALLFTEEIPSPAN
ncbi:hypothetical protein QEZ54_18380 [Catellatospora sp. KI3]|uniref:hypothetical protein n=1 Tax=Catellatospora sp. KI3 TaxID=3041620 RepID=UPI002482B434|nr:hypothetical protein [Catellatospora sp. KI3]MDI1462948.1 hypothetical protein [Catellatospora sp. KI3]